METVKSPPEQRIILSDVGWETYERLLADHEDRSAPRFAYDRGMLEIVSPSAAHEEINRAIASLVEVVAEEMDLDFRNLGSTTFRREDLRRGFEPDSCFYLQSEERVRGKAGIDLAVDPPPDLVVEIDITSPSLDKLSIYARVGVPEVWRYDGERVAILGLEGEGYVDIARSAVLPPLTGTLLSRFVEESTSLRRVPWLRSVRNWARANTPP